MADKLGPLIYKRVICLCFLSPAPLHPALHVTSGTHANALALNDLYQCLSPSQQQPLLPHHRQWDVLKWVKHALKYKWLYKQCTYPISNYIKLYWSWTHFQIQSQVQWNAYVSSSNSAIVKTIGFAITTGAVDCLKRATKWPHKTKKRPLFWFKRVRCAFKSSRQSGDLVSRSKLSSETENRATANSREGVREGPNSRWQCYSCEEREEQKQGEGRERRSSRWRLN